MKSQLELPVTSSDDNESVILDEVTLHVFARIRDLTVTSAKESTPNSFKYRVLFAATKIMPASFWWKLPPLPRSKRSRPPSPGFSDEDLQYLESTLRIIESISIDTIHSPSLGSNENEDTDTIQETADTTRPRHLQTDDDTPWIEHARLWIMMHPNTVALFLVFVATLLLARTGIGSIQALIGVGLLVAGLKIMAATEDGFEMSAPRYSASSSTLSPRAAIPPPMHLEAE